MTSTTDICNLALGYLGAERVSDIDNPKTDNEQLLQLFYPVVRNSLLEVWDWSFCIRRTKIDTPLQVEPEWGYGKAYQKPADCYRIIEVRNNTMEGTASYFDWKIENDLIVCDSDVIYVRYISYEVTPNKFSPSFILALAKKLAAEICMQVTENRSLKVDLLAEAEDKELEAINVDNMQGKHEVIKATSLQAARVQSGGYLLGGR